MITTIEHSWRRAGFAILVLLVFGSSVAEIVIEFVDGETLLSMADDLARALLGLGLCSLLAYEYLAHQRTLSTLGEQLERTKGKLARLDTSSRKLASQYRGVMQKQFDAWELTASEQDVVLGMLKGFSFREIAELRQTREKTVRQQASSVYRKAQVASRNELFAWFFEDMLESSPVAHSHTMERVDAD